MALAIGALAPHFTASMDGDQIFSMKDPRTSWMVLYFYPTDDTETCTKQACSFRDNMPLLESKSLKVFGVSPDSVASHNSFIQKYQLPFHLISDPDLSICNAYDVWHEKTLYGRTYMGIVRTTYLIDTEGTIRDVWTNVRVKGQIERIVESSE